MPLYNPISNSDLIAIRDTAGNFVATTVEGALAESAVKITANIADISDVELYAPDYIDACLLTYRSAYAKLAAGETAIYNICFLGDSITEGFLAGSTVADRPVLGFVNLLREKYKTKFGDVGRGFIPTFYPTGESYWTFTGASWVNSPYGIAGFAQKSSAIGETASIDFNGTGISIMHLSGSACGLFTITIDEGEPQAVDASIGNGTLVFSSVTGLADGEHTAVITNTADPVKNLYITGAYEIKGTTGVRVNMCAKSGAYSRDLTRYENIITCEIDKWTPVLTVISSITNDIGNALEIATYTTNIQTLITRAKLYGDVILMANNVRTDKTAAQQDPYVSVLKALAYQNNCVFVNIYKRWNIKGDVNGLMSDTLHPNTYGHWDIATALTKVLFEN